MADKIIETHISTVTLTGEYAYKLKKPLDLGFLDFTTLEKRKFYCEEELRLNKQYAPEIYLEVLPVYEKDKIVDYVLKMREFLQEDLFSNLLKAHKLKENYIVSVAYQLATVHRKAAIAPDEFGGSAQLLFYVQQNFDQMRPYLNDKKLLDQLEKCEKWALSEYEKLKPVFENRKKQGFVRECHGDLHLENIVLYNDKPTIFDCIEFNPDFRWIDTMADIAFLLMDLDEKKRPDLGNLFLNEYLTQTGDYDGLEILRFCLAYRAVVRAKIKLMSPRIDWDEYKLSIDLAEKYIDEAKPALYILHGVSGSGKTTKAKEIAKKHGAVHIRSDVERKKVIKEGAQQYSDQNRQKVYDYLYDLASKLLTWHYSVVVDATFLKKAQRDLFRQLSSRFYIVPCEVNDKIRQEWLLARQHDYSDADVNISQQQQAALEPLTPDERTYIYA